MKTERRIIESLFQKLCKQPRHPFPKARERLNAPNKQGVYIIRKGRQVVHIGRTLRGYDGLRQRLRDHLHGSSSFTYYFLKGHGKRLRKGYTFQCITETNDRKRALLEAHAIGNLCPLHLGIGKLRIIK